MQIIPVIDLMQGQVVHAKQGLRAQYMPITSQLCTSSEPLAIVTAIRQLYPFNTLYIADIDAISAQGNHEAIIKTIAATYPDMRIWLDCGQYPANHHHTIMPVIGTESLHSMAQYKKTSRQAHILSLDHNASGPMGLPILHHTPRDWPNEVICMTLNKVGSNAGMDTERIAQVQAQNLTRAAPTQIYAAGGIRDASDLALLKNLGVAGVLIATALHQAKITATDIAHYSK